MDTTWIATTVLALLAGAGVGAWFGRLAGARALAERVRDAERESQNQQSRAADHLRAVQAKAAKDLDDVRSQWKAQADTRTAAQRAELDKLRQHLSEACDELDRLRASAASARPGADTGHGFAATMPLGDL
jgi:septal ring factor EnvC (AmiA/AmiB activator)